MAPPPKLVWTPSVAASTSSAKKGGRKSILTELEETRNSTAPDITKFDFNKKRIRRLGGSETSAETGQAVGYWIHRDQRVQDNWAALYAQKLALQNGKPLHFAGALAAPGPNDAGGTARNYEFSLKGHMEVAAECQKLNIEYHLLEGEIEQGIRVEEWIRRYNIGCLIVDFSPLKPHKRQVQKLVKALGKNGPLIVQVDAHNVVPVWSTSNKFEGRAYLIRTKIHNQLDEFLTQFPPVIKHPFDPVLKAEKVEWGLVLDRMKFLDWSVSPVDWAKPGSTGGLEMLDSFVHQRFDDYAEKRNVPTVNAQSNLSPWFHFGQVSPQRALLHAEKYNQNQKSMDSFVNECLVWRELSENFCHYIDDYDNINGAPGWGLKTLNQHRHDQRQYVYTLEEFEAAQTHDDIWNAAQIQMRNEGKMHGFLRMYWAKKILEWSESPEEALKIAIYLNDHYNLDGNDANGYAGCHWSITGVNDREFFERDVYGKIRHMTYNGCKKKFDIPTLVRKYGAKAHMYRKKK